MTAWAFCVDCSWTTTAGSVDAAGDGGRHAGTFGHAVITVGDALRTTQSPAVGTGGPE